MTRAISLCMDGQRWHSRWGAQPEQGQGRRVGVGQSLVCKERHTPTEQQKVSLKWTLGQITKANGRQAAFRVELEPQNVSKWERLVPRTMLHPVCGGWTAWGGLTVWFLGFLHSTVSLHVEHPHLESLFICPIAPSTRRATEQALSKSLPNCTVILLWLGREIFSTILPETTE